MFEPTSYAAMGWLLAALCGLIAAGIGIVFGIRKITGVDDLSARMTAQSDSVHELSQQVTALAVNVQNLTAQVAHLVQRLDHAEVKGCSR